MEDLIQEYMEGRRTLAQLSKRLKQDMEVADENDLELILRIKHDQSLVNGMIRDMTESLSIMRSSYYRLRGSVQDQRVQYMDPQLIQMMDVPAAAHYDPATEGILRNQIMNDYWSIIERRMDLLTNKQKSTLERWINQGKSISAISREDGVSRQAIWIRLFGDRTNKGALRILRDGR